MEPKLTKSLNKSGFTLIEFVVVILIMSIFMLYAIPNIESGTKINIDKTARKLAGAILFVRNESIFKKKNLRMMYDLDENTYAVKVINMTDEGLLQEDYDVGDADSLTLEDGVSFMDIDTAYGGKFNFGKTYTHFFTSGMVEKTLIHLKNENDVVKTHDVNVLTGEVDIHDEYYDEESY